MKNKVPENDPSAGRDTTPTFKRRWVALLSGILVLLSTMAVSAPAAEAFGSAQPTRSCGSGYYGIGSTNGAPTSSIWDAQMWIGKDNACQGLLSLRGVGLTGSGATVTTARMYNPQGSGAGYRRMVRNYGPGYSGSQYLNGIPTGARHYACNNCGYWST